MRVGAVDATTGTAQPLNPGANNRVLALAVSGSTVYVRGAFITFGGQTRPSLGAADAITGSATAWNPSPSHLVNALAVAGSTVYAGGDFSLFIGGQPRRYLAALDASSGVATPWNPDPNLPVTTLATDGSVLYAAGTFATIAGQSRGGLAAFDVPTGDLRPWNPGHNGSVSAIVTHGSSVIVGGNFTTIAGNSDHPYIAALTQTVDVPIPREAPGVAPALSHPNPFREWARLHFVLPRASRARVTILDLAGREVARPVDDAWLEAGPHDAAFDGRGLSAGVYVCLLRAGGQSAVRRIVHVP